MDRRKKKTRESVFSAFTQLLSEKDFAHITVGEIIDKADVGRATFYAHFETKEYLLKELCEDLFCHLFDVMNNENDKHHHIFNCDVSGSVFLHLVRHLKNNDNNILKLLSGKNNELFLQYFKNNLKRLVESQLRVLDLPESEKLPESFRINYITSAFVETIGWWVENGMCESPETITEYFYIITGLQSDK